MKLEGMFFLTYNMEEGRRSLGYQGTFVEHIGDGYYLVQLFEWLLGMPSKHPACEWAMEWVIFLG